MSEVEQGNGGIEVETKLSYTVIIPQKVTNTRKKIERH